MECQRILEALRTLLPLHAEEGGAREKVEEEDIVSRLQKSGGEPSSVRAVVEMIGRLYTALALLDESELLQGRWAFVSFPASLMARSVLETLANAGQTFVESGYWVQGGHRPTHVIEEQRQLLRRLELQRTTSHPDGTAAPVRTVHAVWGIIRFGSDFLLRRREDEKRPDFKGYVFPGGRCDMTDLPRDLRTPEALRDLFLIDSILAKGAYLHTLARELHEELDLRSSEYVATNQRTLKPYMKVEGARNNHAYTQYSITMFAIRLNQDGELKVLERVAEEPDSWAWFTASELAIGRRGDGKSAFVDALTNDLCEEAEKYLSEMIPDSGASPLRYCDESDAIDLPVTAGGPLLRGMTGRERPLTFAPERREWELMMILGWHARGLQIHTHSGALTLLGGGWIKLNDGKLVETARSLADRLAAAKFGLVESDSMAHCRLSIDIDLVHFHPECFEYSWPLESEGKEGLTLTLRGIDTTWARLSQSSLYVQLPANLSRDIHAIEHGDEPLGDPARESYRIFGSAKVIGLRKFISGKKKAFRIMVPKTNV